MIDATSRVTLRGRVTPFPIYFTPIRVSVGRGRLSRWPTEAGSIRGALVVGADTQRHVSDTSRRNHPIVFNQGTDTVRPHYCDCQYGGCREAADLRALFHDIGNHLAAFSCILESLDEHAMSPALFCHFSVLRTHITRMLHLLRDSMDREPQPETVEVRALVDEIVSVANARSQATVIMTHGPQRWLCTHPAALWRAVANVVDNAVRAAGPAGEVEISVLDTSPHVVIDVVDDGPGFGKGPAGTASLGLGITTSLAEQCGGRVEVLSTQPHGVRVRLEFQDLEFQPGRTSRSNDRT